AAAHVGFVHDIVMQQGRGVQEFNDGGQQAQVVVGIADRFATEQNQQGAQALAAGGDDVVADLFYQGDVRGKSLANNLVDGGKIVRHHAVKSLGLHGVYHS